MGTRFEFVLSGGNARDAAAAMQEEVLALHERWSVFRKDSFISHVNREAARDHVRLDADTWEVLRLSRAVWLASHGAFDITIGSLMRSHGFRDEAGENSETECSWGMSAVEIDDNARTVVFTRPGITLDLGGIAKGYALDRCAAIARECGVERALMHGGTSTVVAIGAPPERPGWAVKLTGGDSPPHVNLCDAALSVSAGHSRSIIRDGRTLGHIIDPRSGEPIEALGSAAVIASSAAAADAWSTAIFVLGEPPPSAPLIHAAVLGRDAGAWRVPDAGGAYDASINRFRVHSTKGQGGP